METLAQSLRGAAEHQGTAIVEVWQNCKVHIDGNHDDMIDRQIPGGTGSTWLPGDPSPLILNGKVPRLDWFLVRNPASA